METKTTTSINSNKKPHTHKREKEGGREGRRKNIGGNKRHSTVPLQTTPAYAAEQLDSVLCLQLCRACSLPVQSTWFIDTASFGKWPRE